MSSLGTLRELRSSGPSEGSRVVREALTGLSSEIAVHDFVEELELATRLSENNCLPSSLPSRKTP